MKKAFTLAEVLITLAIIGIVAAMTIPTLVKNYKKKVITVRLQHFASMWRQGYQLVKIENGENFYGELKPANPESAENFYKKYFAPYIKTIKTEQNGHGMIATFANGSGVYFYRISGCDESMDLTTDACTYIVFCPQYKDCKTLDKGTGTMGGGAEALTDGTKTFSFYLKGNTPDNMWTDGKRETILRLCKSYPGYCTALIEHDGWVIKDDYPYKI